MADSLEFASGGGEKVAAPHPRHPALALSARFVEVASGTGSFVDDRRRLEAGGRRNESMLKTKTRNGMRIRGR